MYVIIAEPTLAPYTTPVVLPTTAIEVLLLLQVPPLTGCPSVVVVPTHAPGVPVMGAGEPLTVTVVTALQPPPTE